MVLILPEFTVDRSPSLELPCELHEPIADNRTAKAKRGVTFVITI